MVLVTVLLAKNVEPCTRVQVISGRLLYTTKAVTASAAPVWGQEVEVDLEARGAERGVISLELLRGEAVVGRGRFTVDGETKYGYVPVRVDTGGEVMVSWAVSAAPTPSSGSRRVTPLSAAEVIPGHADAAVPHAIGSDTRPPGGYSAPPAGITHSNPYTPLSHSLPPALSAVKSPLRPASSMNLSFASQPSDATGHPLLAPTATALAAVLHQLRGMQAHMANLADQQTKLERMVEDLR